MQRDRGEGYQFVQVEQASVISLPLCSLALLPHSSVFTSARALFPPLPPVSSPLSHNAIARCVRGRPTHRRGGRGVDSQPKAKARRRRKRYGVGEVVCRAGGCSSGSSRCSALFASFSPFVAFFFFADVLHEPAVRSTHAPSSFPLAPHETPC